MSRNKYGVRFAIKDDQGKRSNIWKIAVSKSDMYLMSRGFGSDFKVSFHESGECHFAYTDMFIKRTGIKNKDRYIDKWQIPIESITTPVHIFSAIFPSYEILNLDKIENDLKIIWIQSPAANHYIDVCLYILRINYTNIDQFRFPKGMVLLKDFRMQNGISFVYFYREMPLTEDNKIMLEQHKVHCAEIKLKHNVLHRVSSMFTTKLDTGERKICEVFI